MAIVVLMDARAPVSLQVAWSSWFARSRRAALTILVSDGASERGGRAQLQARSLLARDAAFADGDACDDAAAAAADDDRLLRARVAGVDSLEAVAERVQRAFADLFVVLLPSVDSKDPNVSSIGRELLPRISCSVAVVDLGDQRWPLQRLMVAASRGVHSRLAMQLADQLSGAPADGHGQGGRVTAAYVEPDIGSDAQHVGQHVLGELVRAAFDDLDHDIARRVVVAASVDAGLVKAAEVVEPDAIVLGMPQPGLLSARFFGGVPARICKRVEAPVVMLRRAMPLGNRLRRGAERLLERVVPQVERSTRVELAARVQSSSSWNFDFVALISLSTVIAALGLLQDSSAVIIGAMLVAPLMTPILGVGLALAQGNAQLLKLASRTIFFGVSTSVGVAVIVGYLDQAGVGELVRTAEMSARGRPGLLDLFVAFASGLAAAYANSRPGLVAALPGVAIAAALVPPIATSGLALSAGDLELAYGAFLLFFTNMVAIVIAAGISLWAVGVRQQGRGGWLRYVGNAFLLAVVVLAVHLAQRSHSELEARAREAVVRSLPVELRALDLRLEVLGDGYRVGLQVAGTAAPSSDLGRLLQARLETALAVPVELQLAYVWEDVLPALGR